MMMSRDRVERASNVCIKCTLRDVEGEFHFILICPNYIDVRRHFIEPYFYSRPGVYNLTQPLNSKYTRSLSNLGKYIMQAKTRSSIVHNHNPISEQYFLHHMLCVCMYNMYCKYVYVFPCKPYESNSRKGRFLRVLKAK